MGKNTCKIKYETVVQLLVLAAAISTPFLASILKDLELFSVSKSTFITFCSSIKPWFCPLHVYLLVNFIIFFIFASSFIRSNTIIFNPTTDHTHDHDHDHDHSHSHNLNHHQSLTEPFIESSFVCQTQTQEPAPLSDQDVKCNHTFEDMKTDTFKDLDNRNEGRRNSKKVVSESMVDKRELRKSKTFQEGASGHQIRKEKYVRILSQEELDRRVEAFINKFKKDNDVK